MTVKEGLLFIGEVLSLRFDTEKVNAIRVKIIKNHIDWMLVVRLCSEHLILPAFYLNLKYASLLSIVPNDLVAYLEKITNANRKRNEKIIGQTIKISELLNSKNIDVIFLKGIAHIKSKLYKNFAERMIGDIDILVEEKDILKAAELLMKDGYTPINYKSFSVEMLSSMKHFPRMKTNQYEAAVEIHRQVLKSPWDKYFNSSLIHSEKQKCNDNVYVPGIEHQILHNILNTQCNDDAYTNLKIYFRPWEELKVRG